MAERLRRYTKHDVYLEAFIGIVDTITSGKYSYNINQDRNILNIKPPVFKRLISEKHPELVVKDCLKTFKHLEYIITERDTYTIIQWTGKKSERVIAINLNAFHTLKELYNTQI